MILWHKLAVPASWAAGILFLIAAAGLGWYYITFEKRNLEVVKSTQEHFYGQLKLGWLSPDIEIGQDTTDKTDEFHLMVLRTALGRWRIREQAPHAFKNLVQYYNNGFWNSSFVTNLDAAMEKIDQRWREARRQAVMLGGRAIIQVTPYENAGFNLTFAEGTTTSDIGSLIQVLFTVDNDAVPPPQMLARWSTVLDPEPRAYRERHCIVETVGQMHKGKQVYRVMLDLSDSLEWLNPLVQPAAIHFHPEGDWNLTAVEYQLGDSELLKVQ